MSTEKLIKPSAKQQPKTACNLIMSESEITAILDQAHECAEGECAVDDVGDLIVELKSQQKVLSDRLDAIMNAVAHLQAANDAPERKTGEFSWTRRSRTS